MPSTSITPAATPDTGEPSNGTLIRRLLALSWDYRAGCFQVLTLQLLLLTANLGSLGLTGLAIDFVAHHLDPRRPAPRWPFDLTPPALWDPMSTVALLAGAVLVLALVRAWVDYTYQVILARLVQGQIVVQLRGRVYDKLQRLSFRFFDNHASGSIINRVTSDVQYVRMFVDQVLIQVLILVLQLGLSLAYMLRVHVPLTIACLMSTPLLWVGGMWFSHVVRPGYARNRKLVDDLTGTLTESVQGVQVIKGFARQDDQIRRFAEGNGRVRDQQGWIFWRLCAFVASLAFSARPISSCCWRMAARWSCTASCRWARD